MSLYDYKTCQERFGSPYQIGKALANGHLHKMDKGVYSDTGGETELEVLQFKYPDSVVTLGPAEVLKVGMVIRDFNGEKIRTYDIERLLIETARMKSELPSDLYKEVILEFRKRTESMYPAKIGEYLVGFPKRDLIERIIDEEVF